MKRYVYSTTNIRYSNQVLMRSNDGLFELVRTSGVGVKDTPWEGLEVISKGDAKKHVVEIRLDSDWENFNGPDHPVKRTYRDVEVAHGMRMVKDSLEDTERYIEVLKSALDFARKLKNSEFITPYVPPRRRRFEEEED